MRRRLLKPRQKLSKMGGDNVLPVFYYLGDFLVNYPRPDCV